MSQFDVYNNTNPATKSSYPYLLEIQSDLLSDLRTTVVIPLTKKNTYSAPLENLHPTFEISGKQYLAMTTLIAGIDRSTLGGNITSLANSRDEIISSIDFMITGI